MSVTVEKHSKPKDDKAPEMFPLNIKIKKEKTTSYEDSSKSETVDKLSIDVNLTNIFSTTITSSSSGADKGAEQADVKPTLEPLKSSNEILTELFRVFNAAPPEIIEDDSNEASEVKEKKKKKHKHRKKGKKKKGSDSDTDEEQPCENVGEEGEIRIKKKKIKKEKDRERRHDKLEKHEKHKRKHRGETLLVTVKQEPLDKDEKAKSDHVQPMETSREHKHVKHDDTKPSKESPNAKENKGEESKQPPKGKIQIKSLKDSAIFKELATGTSHTKEREHERHHEREKSGWKSGNIEVRKRRCSGSDFSISDGEDPGKGRYYDFYQKKYNSFYASYEQGEEERDRHERKRHRRSSDRDRDRERRRRSGSAAHSHSRSRSHSPEQIDKQKLLEIARKNAISMLKKGTLPGAQNLDGESKTKLISKMRASGKTIEELTEFCKKISNKDNFNDLSSVSSDESDHDADGASKVFHHPFQLKEQAPIVMNIRNATTIQPKSAEEKKALLMQFPVSSGAHHRNTETEWVPVEPKKSAPVPPKPSAADFGAGGKAKLKAILPPSSTFVPQKTPLSDFTAPLLPLPNPSVPSAPAPNAAPPLMAQPTIGQAAPGPSVIPPLFPGNDISQPYHALHVPPIGPPQPPVKKTPFEGLLGPAPQSLLPIRNPVDTTVPPPTMNGLLPLPHTEGNHHQQRPHFPPAHPHHAGSPGLRLGNGHRHGHDHGPGHEPGYGPAHGSGHGPHPVDRPNFDPAAGPMHGIGRGPGPGQGPGNGLGHGPGPGSNNVFQNQPDASTLDVSQIVSQRLNAMRKLQENPSDPEARQLLYNTQKDMSTWASSKVMPGQFVGSTGVNCLSQRELAEGYQPWATRDMMKQSAPVTGGMGMHLLQKMGWQPGEGLGKEKNGSLQPLLLDVKLDKRGLGEGQDKPRAHQFPGQQLFTRRDNRPRPPAPFMNVQVNTDGKHPVSILGEYATKRRWNAPHYELVHESGPGHSKNFIFKVLVNGLEYQPAISNNTKKEAKATAAKFCLQQLGVMIT